MLIEVNQNGVKVIVEFLPNGVADLICKKVYFENYIDVIEKRGEFKEYVDDYLHDVYNDLLGEPMSQDVINRIIAKTLVERQVLPSTTVFNAGINPIVSKLDTSQYNVHHVSISLDQKMMERSIFFNDDKVPAKKRYTMSYEELLEVCPRSRYLNGDPAKAINVIID